MRCSKRGNRALAVIGRLKPAATLTQAHAETASIAREIEKRFPDANAGWSVAVVPLDEHPVGSIKSTVFLV